MNPKVFVSHASEDKDRFVIEFAKKLRSKGVDAWLDRWEMLPGDSLVDKIFEEGLKEAKAVIVVLSKNSVEKPWVKEELNTSIVHRLSKGTKVIPVVLDNCVVPESLKSTLWESIKNLEDYGENFERILLSIFGKTDKPVLGDPPSYVAQKTNYIAGLVELDNLILKISSEFIIENDEYYVDPERIFWGDGGLGMGKQDVLDSIEVLESHGYLNVTRFIGGGCHYEVSDLGFDKYAQAYIPNYANIVNEIIRLIVNEEILDSDSLSEKTGSPKKVTRHVMTVLEQNGHVRLSNSIGGPQSIYHVAASLRRLLA